MNERMAERPRCRREEKSPAGGPWAAVQGAVGLLVAALREIFDEAAYARFLERNRLTCSRASYGAFLEENCRQRERRPRCC